MYKYYLQISFKYRILRYAWIQAYTMKNQNLRRIVYSYIIIQYLISTQMRVKHYHSWENSIF